MDEMENSELMDFETLQEKRSDELTELLDKRDMKQLQRRMEEMNEFDVAEFLTQIEDNRMPMVFRLLSKETAADVFANFEAPEQERIINSITDSELAGIIEELYVDDAVDMMEEMPANVVKRVMRAATPATRTFLANTLLSESEEIQVRSPWDSAEQTLYIFNAQGALLAAHRLPGATASIGAPAAPGTYLLTLQEKTSGKELSQKIIIR